MEPTVPTTPTDAEHCDVPWCQQPASHLPENHLRLVAVVEPSTWNSISAVLVTVEAGWGEADPMPVLTMAGKDGDRVTRRSVRLTWREAAALAGWLVRAVESLDPDRLAQRRAPVDVRTHHEAGEWEHALLRLGASGTLEATGTAGRRQLRSGPSTAY